jgi:hypothetical protein
MKYQEEIHALLKKAERSRRAASSMIESHDFDFSYLLNIVLENGLMEHG